VFLLPFGVQGQPFRSLIIEKFCILGGLLYVLFWSRSAVVQAAGAVQVIP